MPQLVVVAGPNGSGKTTFITQLLAGARTLDVALPDRVLNPDEFARAIEPVNPDRVALAAGRAVLAQRAVLLAARLDFAIETTLSGQGELRLLLDARSAGYHIALVYIATEYPAENVMRIGRRYEEQNRSVPGDIVLRRYERSLGQLSNAVARSDVTYLLDNTSFDFAFVARCEGGRIAELSDSVPCWAERALAVELASFRAG